MKFLGGHGRQLGPQEKTQILNCLLVKGRILETCVSEGTHLETCVGGDVPSTREPPLLIHVASLPLAFESPFGF
jgi:hypothetical protein